MSMATWMKGLITANIPLMYQVISLFAVNKKLIFSQCNVINLESNLLHVQFRGKFNKKQKATLSVIVKVCGYAPKH